MKHKRDFKALEKRRLRGGKMLARGLSKSEVARRLDVTRQKVASWEQRMAKNGRDGLKRGELGKVLMAGALAAGCPTELWTLPRVGKLISKRFDVEYSIGHLWHLLRRLMPRTCCTKKIP